MGIEKLPQQNKQGHYINKNGDTMYTVRDTDDRKSAFLAKGIAKDDICNDKVSAKFFNIFNTEQNAKGKKDKILSATELRSVFEAIDNDKDGALSENEITKFVNNAVDEQTINETEKNSYIQFIKELAKINIELTKNNENSTRINMNLDPPLLNCDSAENAFNEDGSLKKGINTIDIKVTIPDGTGGRKELKIVVDAQVINCPASKSKNNFRNLTQNLQNTFFELNDEVVNNMFNEIDGIYLKYSNIHVPTEDGHTFGLYNPKSNYITLLTDGEIKKDVLIHELGHAIDDNMYSGKEGKNYAGKYDTEALGKLFSKFSKYVKDKYGFVSRKKGGEKASYALNNVQELFAEYYAYTRGKNSSMHGELFKETIKSDAPEIKEMYKAFEEIIAKDRSMSGNSIEAREYRIYGYIEKVMSNELRAYICDKVEDNEYLSEEEKEKSRPIYESFSAIRDYPEYEAITKERFIESYLAYLQGNKDYNIPPETLKTIEQLEELLKEYPEGSIDNIPNRPKPIDTGEAWAKFYEKNPKVNYPDGPYSKDMGITVQEYNKQVREADAYTNKLKLFEKELEKKETICNREINTYDAKYKDKLVAKNWRIIKNFIINEKQNIIEDNNSILENAYNKEIEKYNFKFDCNCILNRMRFNENLKVVYDSFDRIANSYGDLVNNSSFVYKYYNYSNGNYKELSVYDIEEFKSLEDLKPNQNLYSDWQNVKNYITGALHKEFGI